MPVGSAYQNIGLYPTLHQKFYGVLRGFGFELAGCCQIGNKRQVDDGYVVIAQFPVQLPYGFNIGQGFNIAYGTTDFCYNDIINIFFAENLNTSFDFIRNMRNHLYGFAQVITTTFFFNYTLIDASGGYIIILGGTDV